MIKSDGEALEWGSAHGGKWDFYNPVRLFFGEGQIDRLAELTQERRTLVLTTPGFTRRGLTRRLVELLGYRVARIEDTVQPNPDLVHLEELGKTLEDDDIELIVSVGGGSVIDTAKVLSAVIGGAADGFSLRKHLQDGSKELNGQAIPVIAVPTTAGTGSEVTPFATVWDMEAKKKYSLSGPKLFPYVAVLDPRLTASLPREITIHTGLDAISQAFEAIWNRNATPITTLYATEALRLGLETLPRLVEDLENARLRSRMMQASLLAGLAISRTRTALAHSMSYPLTMHYGMPHGLACSFTLPAILRFNAEADPGRFRRLAECLGFASVDELHDEVNALFERLEIRTIVQEYTSGSELSVHVPEMFTPGRADNNLRSVERADLMRILHESELR